jgi:hypothetical protein
MRRISKSSAPKVTKLLNLQSYKVTVVMLCNHVTWLAGLISATGVDPHLTFFYYYYYYEAKFHLHGHVSSKHNWYWSSVNPHLIHDILLHGIKVGVRCTMNAIWIIGPIFYAETINSDMYERLILTEFFTQLTEEEWLYAWFQQDSATAHTADDSWQL